MKKITVFAAAVLMAWTARSGLAVSPCTTGTLADYVSNGETGCLIGATSFVDFEYEQSNSDNLIPAQDIIVTPILDPNHPGFTFTVSSASAASWLVPAGHSYQATIHFVLQQTFPKGEPVLAVQQAQLGVSGGQFEGGELLVDSPGCLRGFLPCAESRPSVDSGIPIDMQVSLTPGLSETSFPGTTESIGEQINITVAGPSSGATPTGFTTINLQYVLTTLL